MINSLRKCNFSTAKTFFKIIIRKSTKSKLIQILIPLSLQNKKRHLLLRICLCRRGCRHLLLKKRGNCKPWNNNRAIENSGKWKADQAFWKSLKKLSKIGFWWDPKVIIRHISLWARKTDRQWDWSRAEIIKHHLKIIWKIRFIMGLSGIPLNWIKN